MVMQIKEEFGRAVFRRLFFGNRQRPQIKIPDQLLAKRLRKILHVVKRPDALLINPFENLRGPERLLASFRQIADKLVKRKIPDIFLSRHTGILHIYYSIK